MNTARPGYICESDDDAVIYSTSSEVTNENYKIFFDKTTCYSGPNVLGFDDETFIEQLQVGILFFPFENITNGITVFVATLGSSDEKEFNFAGKSVCTHIGATPTDVWKRLPILKDFDGKELFGLYDQFVIQAIKKYIDTPYYTSFHWNDLEIMTLAFKACLKKKISVININWNQFFVEWKQQLT
ncbi:4047_t:CDS:2, partial [Entrophospora sp. SA101]